jgi:hypothetical protein
VRPVLTAFLLGAVAVGLVTGAAAAALVIVADEAGWNTFRAAIGPLELLAFERSGAVTTSTLGPGLALPALAGGVLNAALARFLVRRGRQEA